jgi:flagellar protein FliS
MQRSGYTAYQSAVTTTTTRKEDLLLLLYEGALKFIRFAKRSLEQKQWSTKGEKISRVLDILTELDCALDHQIGGELATNLASLYRYMATRLTYANLHNDVAALEEVEGLLTELQEAFVASVPTAAPKSVSTARVTPLVAMRSEGLNIAV